MSRAGGWKPPFWGTPEERMVQEVQWNMATVEDRMIVQVNYNMMTAEERMAAQVNYNMMSREERLALAGGPVGSVFKNEETVKWADNPLNRTGSGPGTYRQASADSIADRPFKFNPPLHKNARPRRVDFGTDDPGVVKEAWNREQYSPRNVKSYNAMRLGRIVMSENALGNVANRNAEGQYKKRWGFRFLYNPAEVATRTGASDQVVLNTHDPAALILSGYNNQNFQTHALSLLLNRQTEVQAGKLANLRAEDYAPVQGVTTTDLSKMIHMGTAWDLEFLWRISNGVWNTEDLGDSGNLGMLQPNPAYLILGPGIRHYGFIQTVQYQHKQFSDDMVPMLTEVALTFRRSLHTTMDEADKFIEGLHTYGGNPKEIGSTVGGSSGTVAGGSGEFAGDLPSSSSASPPFRGSYPTTATWTYSKGGGHYAYDYGCPLGTEMLAIRDGVILDMEDGVRNNSNGVNPGSNSPSNWITLGVKIAGRDATVYYQHLSPGILVRKGQTVKKGQVIAKSGNSGNSSGAHLHIAAMWGRKYKSGRYDYMANGGKNLTIIYPPTRAWTT